MAENRLSPGRAEMEWLLSGRSEFMPPAKVLSGLSAANSQRRIDGFDFNIAQLVSHLDFWQRRRIRAASGEELDYPDDFVFGVTDFPEVGEDGWEELRDGYLNSFEELLTLSESAEKMKAMVFDDRDAGFALVSHSTHNAYHLGQIVMMRKLLGLWPPPEGGSAFSLTGDSD